jgi:hypothetical protein
MHGIQKLIAGDSLDFVTSVEKYPATDGWSLKYRLVPRFTAPAQAPITITATVHDVTAYRVQVGPTVTQAWAAGRYSWASWVEQAGQRITLEQGGELTVAPDPGAAGQGTDVRTSAEQALEAVSAMLLGKATTGVESYTIAGRTLKSYALSELLMLQTRLQAEVIREKRAAAIAAGLRNPRHIGVRLDRA